MPESRKKKEKIEEDYIVLRVALSRFDKKPAYWVDLILHTQQVGKATVRFWWARRSWKFHRGGFGKKEVVEGGDKFNKYRSSSSPDKAINDMDSFVTLKISDGWKIHEFDSGAAPGVSQGLIDGMMETVKKKAKFWGQAMAKKEKGESSNPVFVKETTDKPESKKKAEELEEEVSGFKAAQKKRRIEAAW